MRYLLDTNTCIQYLSERSASVVAKVNKLEEGEAVVCSVVKAEMLYGALRSRNPERTSDEQRGFFALFDSLPFDDAAAEHYARVRADLSARGTPIGANDLIIAAIALANDLTLVTHNTREFERVLGLRTEDWEADSDPSSSSAETTSS